MRPINHRQQRIPGQLNLLSVPAWLWYPQLTVTAQWEGGLHTSGDEVGYLPYSSALGLVSE